MSTTVLSIEAYPKAQAFLSELGAPWAQHIALTGPCRHATKAAREPYEALVRAIAYQQLHSKAGDAILARLLALYGGTVFPSPEELLATDPVLQRSCGLSAAKVATIRGIAEAALKGVVPTRAEAERLSDEELIARLVPLRGVGRWTVEMLMIYTLERSDILPMHDLGVREGYKRLMKLDAAPTPLRMEQIGRAWSPYRTVATWYLWQVPAQVDYTVKPRQRPASGGA